MTNGRRKFCWWGAALAGVLTANSLVLADLPRYQAGHADIGVGYEDNDFDLHFHAHAGATVDGLVLTSDQEWQPEAVRIVVPLHPVVYANYGFGVPQSLGLASDANIWNLPSTPVGGVPFLGLSTVHLNDSTFSGVELSLLSMEAPSEGQFTMWGLAAPFTAATFYMTTSGGIGTGDKIDLSVPLHEHMNFAFSKAGDYKLELKATGYLKEGGTVTDTGTFNFQVVPEPSSLALAGIGLGSCLSVYAVRRRRAQRVSGQKA